MPVQHNKTGRSKKGPPFVKLPWYLVDSPAWRSLTPAARAVYVELARVYNGRNNGTLALSVRDAAAGCRINKDTAGKAFRELQDRGLVERVTEGRFSLKIRHAAEWRLTVEVCNKTGAMASKAFMRWRPADPEESRTRSQTKAEAVPSNGTVTPFPRREAC